MYNKFFQFIIILMLLILLIIYIKKNKREHFKSNIKYNLPVTAYIVKNMDMTIQGKKIKNNITKEHIKKIFKIINEQAYNKFGINFEVIVKEYNYINTDDKDIIEEKKKFLTELADRDRSSYFDKNRIFKNVVEQHETKRINIYFIPFYGNERQGAAGNRRNFKQGSCPTPPNDDRDIKLTRSDTNIPMIFIGTWTNKNLKTQIPKGYSFPIPIDRLTQGLVHTEGTPTLLTTVCHEIGHILGLDHIESQTDKKRIREANSMVSETSSFIFEAWQKDIMIHYAVKYLKNLKIMINYNCLCGKDDKCDISPKNTCNGWEDENSCYDDKATFIKSETDLVRYCNSPNSLGGPDQTFVYDFCPILCNECPDYTKKCYFKNNTSLASANNSKSNTTLQIEVYDLFKTNTDFDALQIQKNFGTIFWNRRRNKVDPKLLINKYDFNNWINKINKKKIMDNYDYKMVITIKLKTRSGDKTLLNIDANKIYCDEENYVYDFFDEDIKKTLVNNWNKQKNNLINGKKNIFFILGSLKDNNNNKEIVGYRLNSSKYPLFMYNKIN
jgi:hypothetical protein